MIKMENNFISFQNIITKSVAQNEFQHKENVYIHGNSIKNQNVW